MKIIFLRGPSGSGKSTYAAERWPGATVCSADNFFMVPGESYCTRDAAGNNVIDHDLEYRFDPSKLGEAHAACLTKFINLLETDLAIDAGAAVPRTGVIVVDNTFTRLWEIEAYLAAVRLGGFEADTEIHELRVTTIAGLKFCAEKNSHGTPLEVVSKMATGFESYTGDIKTVVMAAPAEYLALENCPPSW